MAAMSPDDFVAELWAYAREIPMLEHPWFDGIVQHRWNRDQIVLGEVQHYLRVRTNPIYFSHVVAHAAEENDRDLLAVVLENFSEEMAQPESHVDVMYQFLDEAGISREEADHAEAAPGTAAAIEILVGGCARRSAIEGIAMVCFTEAQHGGPDGVAARVYRELTGHYGFSDRAAGTYALHATQDVGHGERQIDAIRRHAADEATQARVREAVRLGLNAYTLEWDGHVQAMTGRREFWSGRAPVRLSQPAARPRPEARG